MSIECGAVSITLPMCISWLDSWFMADFDHMLIEIRLCYVNLLWICLPRANAISWLEIDLLVSEITYCVSNGMFGFSLLTH